MSLDVLKTKNQISDARKALVSMGASAIDTPLQKFLKRFGLGNGISLGDHIKSWDLLKSVEFITANLNKNAAILDVGCFASELIVSLHQIGYKNLYGVDLNEQIEKMPHQNSIKYVKSDFMKTPFENEKFDLVSSISVIEHGYKPESLFKEMSRILKPDGYFLASFDYWPEKIETQDTKFFGMDWLIFSKNDVAEMLALAKQQDLYPVGSMKFESGDHCVHCAEKDYTFAWLVLQKKITK